MSNSSRPRVVVIGAGFGGLAAAKSLRDAPVEVLVLDRQNHHLFQPLLYQVATAGLNPADIARPIRAILRRQANCRVEMRDVSSIDLASRTVVAVDGTKITYDHLVVATGATHAYFGHDEWRRDAPGLKTIDDALAIRRKILAAFERAELTNDPDERAELLTFVVVGAGPTGVEMAGAIKEIALAAMGDGFRRIDPGAARVVLVEAADRVLGAFHESLSAAALEELGSLGIEVRIGARVTDVHEHGVDTDSGVIPAATVVWAAGVAASPLGADLDRAGLDRAGRVPVDEHLNVAGHPEVYVVGDLAACTMPDGSQVPGLCPAAIQGGEHAARCIVDRLSGRRPRPFRYRDKGSMATIGRSAAVADLGHGIRLRGWLAWVMWWAVHILFLIDFRSKLYVMVGWAWQYLTFQRGARLITRGVDLTRPSDLEPPGA